MQDRPVRTLRLLGTAAALAAATTIAACGSAAPRTSTGATLAFSNCMRASGVPNFPDLGGSGMLIQGTTQTITVNGVAVNAPAFEAARAQCQKYLPSQRATPTQAERQRQRGLEFAKCMRSHGVPNFPDPKVPGGHAGNQEVYLPGVNPQAPAVQTAAKACGGGPKGP